jgi:hypothetical protein
MTRKHLADDCKDAAIRRTEGRAKQEARAENRSVYEIHEDRPGWRTSKELMYRMYGMPISPKAPTFGAGAKIGNAVIVEKVHF